MKLPNFVNLSADSASKIGHEFNNIVVQKLKLEKTYLHKKCATERVFCNEKKQKYLNDS